jgi:hypothetical protein
MPRRNLRRYALWLYGSCDFATFDPSLTAPELFLELSELHNAAGMLQDESFGNEVMDAMVAHLITRYDQMLLEDFLTEFVRTNAKGTTGRKLIADWIVWSMVVSDVRPKDLLQRVQDADFCYAVAKAVLRKTCREWEGECVPPYTVSPCFYHVHSQADRAGCRVERKSRIEVGGSVV